MRRARERGSICLYVSVCLVSLGLLTGAIVPLATSLRARTTRRTDELRANMAFEAGVALVQSQTMTLSETLGVPVAVSFPGVTGSVTATANDAQLAKSLSVAGAMTIHGRTYRFSRVVGNRLPSPFAFALTTDVKYDAAGRLITGSGGSNGDVYASDDFKVKGSGSIINGNIVAKRIIDTEPDTIVTGRLVPNYLNVPYPTVAEADYAIEATSLAASGYGTTNLYTTALNGITFASPNGSVYVMKYFANDLTLKGTLSGKGTIFVRGNLTINGDLRYATSANEVAIIVKGNITVATSATTVEGFFYTAANFEVKGSFLSVPRGVIVAQAIKTDVPLSIVRDNAIRDDADEGLRLRLPYYWP